MKVPSARARLLSRQRRAAVTGIERYLENPAALLAPALAKRHGLDPGRIAIGNGSDDLLARLARIYLEPGSEMIRSCNGYLKTPNYAYANNATPISVDRRRSDAIGRCHAGRRYLEYAHGLPG